MLHPDFVPDGGHVQQPDPAQANNFFAPGQPGAHPMQQQQYGIPLTHNNIPPNHPGATGLRYYTIQRVNGNGGNGKGDGVAGPHKHGLAESDRVKKNSIQRFLMKKDKEDKKTQVRLLWAPFPWLVPGFFTDGCPRFFPIKEVSKQAVWQQSFQRPGPVVGPQSTTSQMVALELLEVTELATSLHHCFVNGHYNTCANLLVLPRIAITCTAPCLYLDK